MAKKQQQKADDNPAHIKTTTWIRHDLTKFETTEGCHCKEGRDHEEVASFGQ